MKKYFLSIVALAGMLFATSCQESLVEPQVGGTTTFTVQLPDAMGTKAYGDEISTKATINKLYVEVYSKDGDDQSPVFVGDFDVNEAQAKVSLNLVATQKYDIIFWAQNDNAYSWTDLRSVAMNRDHHNSETGAAFYAVLNDFEPSTSGQQEVILRRPFAQLNLGTTTTVSTGEVQVLESTIEILGVAKTFDRVSNQDFGQGGVSDVNAWTYTSTQNEVAEGKLFVNNVEYTYVSMDYFAVPGNRAVVDVKATIKVLDPKTNAESVIVREIKQVPVQMNYRTNIVGNLISSTTDFVVTIEEGFVDENEQQNPDNNIVVVESAVAAQAALDNAKPGDVIELVAGVNYGTLLIRPVEGKENTITDCDYLVYRNEMLRKVENLTIIGAPGATVDAIKVVAGYVENSGSTGYVVDIKNLVINSVEFTDKHTNAPHSYASPIFFDLSYINVNGLTVQNCKLIGNNDKMNFVYLYGSGNPSNSTFVTAAKDITISGNTVDGVARLCELRQTENVTITGNTIKNTALHGILLTVDNGTYSGNVTITENTAENINERFVRMAGAGDAVVLIKDNSIINYQGADADYIKVTDGTNVTIENNSFVLSTTESLEDGINNAGEGAEITLASGVDYGAITLGEVKDVTIKGDGTSVMIFKTDANSKIENVKLDNVKFAYTGATADCGVVINENAQIDNLVIENSTFVGTGAKAGRGLSGKNPQASIKFVNCSFEDLGYPIYAWGGYDELVIDGCTFDNIKSWAIMPQSGFDGDLTVTGCTFKNCIGGGLVKAGTLTAGHTFTFTNNTITGCTVAGDHNWFQFNVSAGNAVISGNVKDGVSWTPGVADGLK